jgi:hypothetical protein
MWTAGMLMNVAQERKKENGKKFGTERWIEKSNKEAF